MGEGPSDWLRAVSDLPADSAGYAAFFHARAELRNPGSVELLHEEVVRTLYADHAQAVRLARAARTLADDLNDPVCQAAALRALGHVSYAASDYEGALRHYGEALDILRALGSEHQVGRTLMSGLQSLIYLGRYEDACEWAARADEIFERSGDHVRRARLSSNVGNILFRQDRCLEALASYEKAYDTLCRLGEHHDVAGVLSNMAVCNVSLGRFARALELYAAARDYCLRHDLAVLVAGADYNIAYLHYLQGDFMRAIELYKASRDHARKANDAYHAALCDLDEAEVYLELNLHAEAARLAGQAAAAFAALRMPYERGKALVTRAIVANRQGRSGEARRFFAEARTVLGAERNALWPALIDLHRATLLEGEGRYRRAERLCRRAYRVLAGSPMPGHAALAELLLSRLLLHENRVALARQMSGRACARLETSGTPWLRFHAHFVRGQADERSGDGAAAFDAYQTARLEIEKLRGRLWGDDVKISFLKDKLAVYENLVKARLLDRHDRDRANADAFRFIQQAKSRSLADLISRPLSPPPESGPAGAPAREIDEARADLDSHYRQLERLTLSAQAPGARQIEALEQKVRECEARFTRLLALAPAALPGAGAGSPDTLTLQAIQASIPARAMLLEYYAVKDVLYVCLLNSSGLEIVPLVKVEEVRTRTRLLRFQLGKARPASGPRLCSDNGTERVTASHLRDLYDDLIGPVRDRLTHTSHLIFAPHGFLHHLPFHALYGPGGYVADEFTSSYAPSATVFALCSARQPSAASDSLVMGVPDSQAPNLQVEAETVARILPQSRLFLAEEATDEVLRRLGPSSRYLHLATHGIFRRDNPLFSAVRLGNCHLTLLDLYRLPLSAELVTLSGCSTGLNVVVGGDELLGLMRGLLFGGAHSVMLSLWDVHDRSAGCFMQCFYEELLRTGHKAEAVQSAMRELRREFPDPYHWAPFVLAGKHTSMAEINSIQ